MALGTVASKPDCNLKIIPVGMNYFHAHKFRSRAVIEFGTAIDVPAELAKKFEGGGRRDAIGEMLEVVRQGLISVTVTTPDYDTLMVRSHCSSRAAQADEATRSSKLFVVYTTPRARSFPYQESSS
jgi:hypothetical protein